MAEPASTSESRKSSLGAGAWALIILNGLVAAIVVGLLLVETLDINLSGTQTRETAPVVDDPDPEDVSRFFGAPPSAQELDAGLARAAELEQNGQDQQALEVLQDLAQRIPEGEQPIERDAVLTILVEKDFQCLHKTEAEKDPDAFPHPLAEE